MLCTRRKRLGMTVGAESPSSGDRGRNVAQTQAFRVGWKAQQDLSFLGEEKVLRRELWAL